MPELTNLMRVSVRCLGNDTGKVDWCYTVAGFKGPTGTFRFAVMITQSRGDILSRRVLGGGKGV